MPLFIRDELVNTLAERVANLTGNTKTDAVRIALESSIKALQASKTLTERVGSLQEKAKTLGLKADADNDKKHANDPSREL